MSSNIFESIIYKSHNKDGSLDKSGDKARVIKESCVSPSNTPAHLFEGAEDLGVIIDPDMTAEEYNEKVSSTEATDTAVVDGKVVPVDDEHIDDYVLTCPICGANYFAEEVVTDGVCPVCNEDMSPTVQGQVADPADAAKDEAPKSEDEDKDEEPKEEPTEAAKDDEDENKEADPELIVTVDTEVPEKVEEGTESAHGEDCDCPECKDKCKADDKKDDKELDEKACSKLFSQFIRENYKNADSVKFNSAKMTKGNLVLEGLIRFKSGNTRKFSIVSEGFKFESGRKLFKDASKIFTESSHTPFIVTMSVENGLVTPTKLAYNYKVQESTATYKVVGRTTLNESK